MLNLNFDKVQKIDNQCEMPIPLVNTELWRIMSSNQRKSDVKLATLRKSLDKVVTGALNILVQKSLRYRKKSLKYKQLHKWLQILLQLLQVSYEISLKRRERNKVIFKTRV